ncbi:MAG: potassium channel family protein [Propylenella sp.]
MFADLALGSAVLAITVVIHTFGLIALTAVMRTIVDWFRLHRHRFGQTVAMLVTVLGLFGLHGLEIWAWAGAYLLTGAVADLETALYFSTATFSTLGYGDITLDHEWRLFGSLEGINGFLLIGWSTAYLVAAATRLGPFRIGEHF